MNRKVLFGLLPWLLILVFSCADLSKVSGVSRAPQTTIPAAPKERVPPEKGAAEPSPERVTEPVDEPVPEAARVQERLPEFVTLVAAGDNLIHEEIYQSALRDGTYRFESLYAEIKPYIEGADIAFINQETPLAGKRFGFSGYPRFNSPQEIGAALVNSGFNVINHANNHSMDMGAAGVLATRSYWDAVTAAAPDIACLGIHQSPKSRRERQVIIEKNHITLGFLAYTYGTNGIPLPADKPYLVSLIDTKVMAQEIDALRSRCDVLVVSMHWGNEYQTQYDAGQERLSAFLAEHQVDLVLGHHPHVLQGHRLIPRPDGKTMLCFYSLGNFISAQSQDPVLLGGLAYVKIKKEPVLEGGKISIEDYGIIPVVTHYEQTYTGFRVYPLHQYSAELAVQHGIRFFSSPSPRSVFSLGYCNALAERILKDHIIRYNPFISD